jgi:hypothetical protein
MDFTKYLQSRKPVILKETFKGLFGVTETREMVIPPLNTDVRFGNVLPEYSMGSFTYDPRYEHGDEPHESIDENFSWAIPILDHDSDLILYKKARIHPVFDQQGCGSCWAVAFSTTMSDCLVVGGAVSWAPYISSTFCMACYPQGKCQGGQPAQLALDVEKNGVADVTCIDYSWCENDDQCNIRDSAQHFHVGDQSNKIPNCGCYFNNDKYIYNINPGTDTFSVDNDDRVDIYRKTVQSHILNFGPIIGGYLVLKNFMNGQFTRSNGGVYFDRADYENISHDGTIPFSDNVKSSFNSQGLHAVSIVGWGVAKNIQYDTDKVGDVPYWHCRNSWGIEWGDNGYFKMAMYPFNRTAQFDKRVIVSVGMSNARIGGVIFIRATISPTIRSMKEIESKYKRTIVKTESPQFYDTNAVGGEGIGKEIKEFRELIGPQGIVSTRTIAITAVIIIVVIVAILMAN